MPDNSNFGSFAGGAPFPPTVAGPFPPNAGQFSPGGGYRTNAGYEFSGAEKEIFSGLASAVSFCGIAMLAFGVLAGLGGVGMGLAGLVGTAGRQFGRATFPGGMAFVMTVLYGVEGVLMVVCGLWLTRAASAMKAIVNTSGDDVPNLMTAMVNLRKVFGLWRVAIVVTIVLMTLACVGGMVAAVFASQHHASY